MLCSTVLNVVTVGEALGLDGRQMADLIEKGYIEYCDNNCAIPNGNSEGDSNN
jgi:hypothetical protein